MHTAEVEFSYGSKHTALVVSNAVSQEVGDIEGDRAMATVEHSKNTVRVHIDATDLIALRAALNTWTSLLDVAETIAFEGSTEDSWQE